MLFRTRLKSSDNIKLLDKRIRENDTKLKEQIDMYKQKRKNWIIILCISIFISILSIYINLCEVFCYDD